MVRASSVALCAFALALALAPGLSDDADSYVARTFELFGEANATAGVDVDAMFRRLRFDAMISDSDGDVFDSNCIKSDDLVRNESSRLLTRAAFLRACPLLLYQRASRACEADEGVASYDANRGAVWLYASLSILSISLCGLFGVAVIPIMERSCYQHILQFLIALATGTLCGDALLHLLPHAMAPAIHDHHEQNRDHDHDGKWKGLAAALGVVFFYFTEKGLILITEKRKRKMRLDGGDKLPWPVRVKNEPTANAKPTTETNKLCKNKYSEYPYCYDEIASGTRDDHHVRDDKKNDRRDVVEDESHLTANDSLIRGYEENANVDHANATEAAKVDERKNCVDAHANKNDDRESYTVILREHSQTHHGHSHSHGHVHSPPSSLSSVVWMVIMGDGLHNFTDGMAIGAAFSSNIAGGFSTAIAVLCHELPHEIGDFAVLLKAGMSARRAVFYNMLSSILCLFGMIIGVMVGHTPEMTSWIFAVAAGMFIYIALVDMIPELSTSHSNEGSIRQCLLQFAGLATGIGIMLLIAIYEHDLKQLFG